MRGSEAEEWRSGTTRSASQFGWHTSIKRSTYHRVPITFEYLHGQIDFSLDVKCNKDLHGRKTTGKSDVRLLFAKRNWGQHTFVLSIFKD